MSWSPLLPVHNARKLKAGKPVVAASVSAGGGRVGPKLTILLRPGELDGIAWLTPGPGLQVMVGFGEHLGMLRIMPDGLHILGKVALAKPVGSAVALRLPLPGWLAPGARSSRAVEHEWQDGWIEVTLPADWRAAAEPAAPAPAASKPTPPGRAKQLAAEAAAEARRRAGL